MPAKAISSAGATKDLQRLVGQLLILGFEGTELSTRSKTLIGGVQPGGIILFARNIESPRQTHALLRSAQKLARDKLFLCLDLEGGTVDRLRDAVAPAPSVAEVAASHSQKLFREHGRLLGKAAWTLGFNVDFAPVLDLSSELSRPVMTTRTASAFAEEAIVYARCFLRGLRAAGVLGCGKHFPGLGEASLDSHVQLPVVTKPWKRLWQEDLLPYRSLKRELPFVMVAHCAYPAVAGDKASQAHAGRSGASAPPPQQTQLRRLLGAPVPPPQQTQLRRLLGAPVPASLSRKWITGILRRKIGYNGLVVSDDLDMGGVQQAADVGDAAVSTIQAGADIFLVCRSEENIWRAYNAVLAEAERSPRFRARVEEAARRVLRFKTASKTLQRAPAPPPSDSEVAKLRREMWEFREKLRLTAAAGAESQSTAAVSRQRRKDRPSPKGTLAPGVVKETVGL
ncbi:MAG: glycoside hydrolase family 3 N-terminal domain-containing protein [Candidatus Korobacteraceae bacterium]